VYSEVNTLTVLNLDSGETIANDVRCSLSFFSRLKGLIGKKRIKENEGLFIPNCSSIHSIFMRCNIDIIFLDKNFRITKTVRNIKPYRIVMGTFHTSHVIELQSNKLENYSCQIGNQIKLSPNFLKGKMNE